MKIKINKFNDALLYTNKNIEKVAKNLVNESSNAVLMDMFDDKCHLLDHTTGQIYEADYSFDGKVFAFENFEPVEIERDNSSLRESIMDYFNEEDVDLSEAYEISSSSSSDLLESTISEALASKNVEEIIDYSELEGINEEIGNFAESKVFKDYSELLESHPTSSIKMFTWDKPVRVSLIDEDHNRFINKSIKEKAVNLKKDADFKKNLTEAAKEFLNGNNELLENLVYNTPALLALDKASLTELVGLTVIGNKSLMEGRKEIISGINSIISEDGALVEKQKALLEELPDEEGSAASDSTEVTEKDCDAAVDALKKAKEKVSDEKLASKIDEIIDSLKASCKAGETDVEAMKEAVEILNF